MTAQDLYDNLILPQLAAMGAEVKTPALVAINETIRQLAVQMMESQSDLVMLTWRPSVSTTRTRAYFPDGFQGFREHPVLVGDKNPLSAVTDSTRSDLIGETGKPQHYEIRGDCLMLYPTPDAPYTLQAECWVFPDEIAFADDLPFAGRLDRVIADTALQVIIGGLPLLSTPQFSADLSRRLETALITRKPPLPVRRPIQFF